MLLMPLNDKCNLPPDDLSSQTPLQTLRSPAPKASTCIIHCFWSSQPSSLACMLHKQSLSNVHNVIHLTNLVGIIFYAFTGVYLLTLMVPIILWFCIFWQKGYTFSILYTIIAILGKIGVAITIFVATQNHIGYCYVASEVKIAIAVANAAEACCLVVELLFIRQARKVNQLRKVQMFMEAGKQKGYFWNYHNQIFTQMYFLVLFDPIYFLS